MTHSENIKKEKNKEKHTQGRIGVIGQAVPGAPVRRGVVRNHRENVENGELSFCRLAAAAAALQARLVLPGSRGKTHLAHDVSEV